MICRNELKNTFLRIMTLIKLQDVFENDLESKLIIDS